ncbi:hypothetical protein [Candidatus Williamhamiltonella defendens]|nr:hypothetical protein [Candidatus Hamiltonella defensa]
MGEVLRNRLGKIVLNIGYYIGRPVTITEFIHYVVERDSHKKR